MYSRYGLYFRFTALQTVCKYDQLNEGKKNVFVCLVNFLDGKTNLEINEPGSKFKFTMLKHWCLIIILFIYNVMWSHRLLQKKARGRKLIVIIFRMLTWRWYLVVPVRFPRIQGVEDGLIRPTSHPKKVCLLIIRFLTYWWGVFVSCTLSESPSSQTPSSL